MKKEGVRKWISQNKMKKCKKHIKTQIFTSIYDNNYHATTSILRISFNVTHNELSFPLYLNWILSGFFCWKKIFLLTSCLLSFTIIGLDLFWPDFFSPISCMRSRSAGEISMFIFVDVIPITKSSATLSSVSTIPWTKRQLWREYCSC